MQKQVFKGAREQLIKAKQYTLFFGVMIGVTLLFSGLFVSKFIGTSKNNDNQQNLQSQEKRIPIESAAQSLDQQEVWVDRLEKERDLIKQRLESLEKLMTGVVGNTLTPQVSVPSTQIPLEEAQNSSTSFSTLDASFLQGANDKSVRGGGVLKQDTPQKLQRVSFQLDPQYSKKIKRSVDHYVPAGSFVRGVLTSGVVASTSVQASSNPQPVHIELTHLGNLPRNFKSDIKQCFLIGSAYGDLASERVFMRLEKLSCVERKTGEVIELSVDGYVAGEDGANGLRGIVVDRSGPAMRNAFVGGFFAGMGNFLGQQKSQVPTTIGQGGVAMVNPMTAQHMMEAGAGKGVGNAMEKFSDFYIKRAEQLQPVIEIEPGRRVDVVFKAGFDMNQTVYRQSLMGRHDANRRDTAADTENNQQIKEIP